MKASRSAAAGRPARASGPEEGKLLHGDGTTPTRAPGLGFVISTLSRRIVRSMARQTPEQSVLPAQYPVLRSLKQLKVSTQIELSRLCSIEQPSMAVTLNRMERDGLIVREADEADARRKIVKLTPHGKNMLRVMTESAHAVYERAVEGLSDSEIQAFFDVCAKMTNNLERER
jgi:DNA-binding MarR family transcriptional regulator